MAHVPNVVIDMGHTIATYANTSRREDIENCNKGDNEGKLFRTYDGTEANMDTIQVPPLNKVILYKVHIQLLEGIFINVYLTSFTSATVL